MLESPAVTSIGQEPIACARLVAREQLCLIVGIGDEVFDGDSLASAAAHQLVRPVTREDVDSLISRIGGATAAEAAEDTSRETRHFFGWGNGAKALPPCLEELGEGRFFLAVSPAMMNICRQARLLGEADVNVLLLGEIGTGKEVVARLIHQHSRRQQAKFVGVNCAALPSDMLEQELFGQSQSPYVGQIRDRAGKLAMAEGGTLLIEEIGELPDHAQDKLLCHLQDCGLTHSDGDGLTSPNVRVLATTSLHLDDPLSRYALRGDLYHHLNSFTLYLPPLRERREEIPYFMEEFIRRAPEWMHSGAGGKVPSRLMDVAMLCDWRGNLRELRNFVVRTLIMRDVDAAMRELEAKVSSIADASRAIAVAPMAHHRAGLHSAVRDLRKQTEVQMVKDALNRCGWNRRKAADYLQISYRGLLYKIQQHQLAPEPRASARAARHVAR